MGSNEELSKKYQKKSDKQHVLDNPDTYIGSIENINCNAYVFDEESKKIIEKQITYNPGLYKLFDEGIVNCRDHFIRMQQLISASKDEDKDKDKNYPVTKIDISIDENNLDDPE